MSALRAALQVHALVARTNWSYAFAGADDPAAWRATLAILMCVAAVAALNAFSPYKSRLVGFVTQVSYFLTTFKCKW